MKFFIHLTLSIYLVLLMFFIPPASAESLQKLVEFKRGEVFEADVTNIFPSSFQLYVVGVINSRRNVMLFVYRGTETEARDEVELGSASSIAVSRISEPNTNDSRKFVSVMRDSNGELRAILWAISSDGRLDRLDTVTGPAINRVDVAAGSGDARVVAERANGNLMVGRLRVTGGNRLSFSEEENYGRVKALALEGGKIGGLAMQIGDNTLRVTSFTQSAQSPSSTRGATNEAGEISDLDIVALDNLFSGAWVTITSSKYVNTDGFRPNRCVGAPIVIPYGPIGRGKLIAWQNDQIFSNELKRVGEYEFTTRQGLAHEVAAARHFLNSTGPAWFITGHLGYSKPCGLRPRLELHLWEFDEDDGFRKAATTKLGGDYRGLAMSDLGDPSNRISRFVTVMRGRANEQLKIAVWEANSNQ